MFDFERLDVYQHVKDLNIKVLTFLNAHSEMDQYLSEKWRKASLAVVTKLTHGTQKMSSQDKKHQLSVARANVFKAVAIIETLKGMGMMEESVHQEFYDAYEKASKMLLGMLRSYNKDTKETRETGE